MHRRLRAALLPALFAALVSATCISAVGLPKNLRLSAWNECRVGGVTFRGLGHYINGTRLEPGSIYADCVYGITTCYRDDGTTNKERHQQVHCLSQQDHPPTYQACRVGAIQFTGLAHPIVGERRVPGSVYADCIHGKPKCFIDDGMVDKEDVQVPCDEVEMEKRRRQLGVFSAKGKGHAPWPDRVVCYRVNTTFSADGLKMFEQAVREFQDKAKITWAKVDDCKTTYGEGTTVCNDCKTWVLVTDHHKGCYASAGILPDPNYQHSMNIGPGCQQYNTYVHEMGHVVGLFHEHNHPQRLVIILREKMRIASMNYIIAAEAQTTAYDMGSVMHYDGGDMCVPKDLTLKYCDVEETEANGCVVPKEEHCDPSRQKEFGLGPDLAPSDVLAINTYYDGINPHAKSPQGGAASVSPPPSPPPPAVTTPPPSTTTPPATTPPTTTAPPPTPPTISTTPPTPTGPTLPGINFENIYDVLIKLSDLLSKRRRRLRH